MLYVTNVNIEVMKSSADVTEQLKFMPHRCYIEQLLKTVSGVQQGKNIMCK